MADMIEKLKPLEATENADLKNLVQANLAYLQEEVKDNPDSSETSDLSATATKSLSALGSACQDTISSDVKGRPAMMGAHRAACGAGAWVGDHQPAR